ARIRRAARTRRGSLLEWAGTWSAALVLRVAARRTPAGPAPRSRGSSARRTARTAAPCASWRTGGDRPGSRPSSRAQSRCSPRSAPFVASRLDRGRCPDGVEDRVQRLVLADTGDRAGAKHGLDLALAGRGGQGD